jgi:MoaA/NifB/PqqE/SkfB family radical SAM enzyme
MEEFLNPSVAKYALRRARELGYTGVLFSGGGENLEPAAYDNFLGILKYAKEEIGLRTNLATNGLYLSQNNALVLARLLDTVRFSVSPTTQDYCHAGVIAPNIVQFRKAVDLIRQQSDDYVPTKIYANILMSPDMRVEELEAILRMFSQIGVDAIRLKPKHEKLKGVFTIRPAAYSKLLTRIAEITKDSSLRLPKVTVAKLLRLRPVGIGISIHSFSVATAASMHAVR